jgi:hypothetical protein
MDSRLQGLICGLTQRYGRNVVDAGLVAITANYYSATTYPEYNAKDPKYVFEYESNLGYYDSNNYPSWIKFDFKNKKYNIKKYTIQFGYGNIQNYVQRWLIEGSNDDSTWTIIDNRDSETKKHSNFEIEQYVSRNNPNTEFRYIRLYVKNCWAGQAWIALTSIEFFTDSQYPEVAPPELPHKFSFIASTGKYVNDSLGTAILEGDNFTATLDKGIYTFSVWSYSGTSFAEGVLRIYSPKRCTVNASSTSGYNTTVSIESEIIINAPYSTQITPFIHHSLTNTHYVQNYFYNYSYFVAIDKNQKGRVVVVGYSPFLIFITDSPYKWRIPFPYFAILFSLLK